MNGPKHDDLTHFFRSLQSLTSELIHLRRKIQEGDEEIYTLLAHLQDFMDTIPDEYEFDGGNDCTTVSGEIKSLEDTFLTFHSLYFNLLSTYLQGRPLNSGDIIGGSSEKNTHIRAPRIPLILIHENIYRLTNLIGYYTRSEYFRVYPFFSLPDALEEITMDTNGLILISAGCITDPESVIRKIRSRSWIMPVIVIIGEENAIQWNNPGYYGVVCEECPLDTLISMFLSGLQVQVSRTDELPGEDDK